MFVRCVEQITYEIHILEYELFLLFHCHIEPKYFSDYQKGTIAYSILTLDISK